MAIPKMTFDPYEVLGISNDAAPAAIRSSYKRLILQCHPDKVHDESLRDEKAAQFQKVQEAYELLIDTRRKRKYDEEQVKKAEAAAKPQTTHTHAHNHTHTHGTRSASGPVPGSAERSERPERRERSGTNPSPDDRQREKDRDREARHARRRAAGERRSREESSWNTEEREARKAYQAEYAQREAEEARKAYEAQAAAAAAAQARYQEEQSVPRHKSYNRYAEESPRKNSYDARQPHDIPKEASHPPPPPPPPDVRPGYAEAKAAEEKKIAAFRARMKDETSPISKEDILGRQRAAAAAEALAQERARFEAARMEQEHLRERERESMRGSRDRDRGTDIPQHRERKSSKSPPLRRGSSVASKCDEVPSTPMRNHVYGSSAPSHPSYPSTHPLNTGGHVPRRRHSSPSIEKQTSRMPPREAPTPCDSGYSSPSTDTPIPEKKAPSPVMRTAAEGIDPRTGNWKKYTFEVYVREDAEAQAQANGGVPSHRRRAGSISPSVHPAEPLSGVPPTLPTEFIPKAAGIHGIPFPMAYPASVDPRYAAPLSSVHPHSPPSSHIHSPHASPPRAHRHHHHHSPNHSPRMGAEQFSPGLSRANTTHFHSQSSRSREREPSYGGYAPSLNRGATFSG